MQINLILVVWQSAWKGLGLAVDWSEGILERKVVEAFGKPHLIILVPEVYGKL